MKDETIALIALTIFFILKLITFPGFLLSLAALVILVYLKTHNKNINKKDQNYD